MNTAQRRIYGPRHLQRGVSPQHTVGGEMNSIDNRWYYMALSKDGTFIKIILAIISGGFVNSWNILDTIRCYVLEGRYRRLADGDQHV